jgi:hypothetical protein
MITQGGGIGHFARKKADILKDNPAPAPHVVTTESKQPPTAPNDEFLCFTINDIP